MRLWHRLGAEHQDGSARSFVGGRPMLPPGVVIPVYAGTGTPMTFFFQVAMPAGHRWQGWIVSVFAVTDHAERGACIPDLPSPLAGAALTTAFFTRYQRFFRLLVFEGGGAEPVHAYAEKVAFHALHRSDEVPDDAVAFGRIGAAPWWLLGDEAPASFEGRSDAIAFLFQSVEDYEFATVPGAPRQRALAYNGIPGATEDSSTPEYDLFVANALYLFGIEAAERLIYVVPQS